MHHNHLRGDFGDIIHTVGNDNHRFPRRQTVVFYHFCNTRSAARVKPCGGFNQDFGFHCHNACNRDTAFFTARQIKRRFFHPFPLYADKFRRVQNVFFDLRLGKPHIARTEGNIPINRAFKQLIFGILKTKPDLKARGAGRRFGCVNVLSV